MLKEQHKLDKLELCNNVFFTYVHRVFPSIKFFDFCGVSQHSLTIFTTLFQPRVGMEDYVGWMLHPVP